MFQDTNPIFEFRGLFGVPVQIGGSLFLLLGFYIYTGGGDLVWTAAFAAMLMLSIFLHEIGHAWACLIQGLPVRRVMLCGGGRFAVRALWDSVFAGASAFPDPDVLFSSPKALLAEYLGLFADINGFLAIFNLIPVQPLDGAKLLHLFLLRLTPQHVAMTVTGGIGLVLSILWIPGPLLAYGLGLWLLFFIPAIPLHFAMMRGRLA